MDFEQNLISNVDVLGKSIQNNKYLQEFTLGLNNN